MSAAPGPGYDVVVVGGGLAGCAALLSAAEQGARAVLLERREETGGSTVLSAGLSAFAGTDEQAAQGIADSADLLRADLLTTGHHVNDPALVDAYCAHQEETYRWFRGLGIRYGTVHAAAGQSVPRSHPTDTRRLLDVLTARAAELGAPVVTGVRVRRLLTEDGRVTGVEAETGDGVVEVRAAAVVLATGGFSQNPELLARFAPQMRLARREGGAGSQGDGLLMGMKLGAGVVDTPYVKGTYGIYPEDVPGERGTGILAVYKGAIAVNREGRRFVDESRPYKELGDASLAQPGGVTYQVFDAGVMARSDDETPIYDFAARERSGLLTVADGLPELADALGLPAAELVATVERYDAAIDAGTPDEQGRVHLSGGVGERVPLRTPPFYAQPSTTVVLATYCGLTVDPTCAVRDVFGDPIPGLLAAGEVVGGFHGGGYMTGTSIGKSGVFGRIAGRTAAALARAATVGAR
ncbi:MULTISPECIES: FAD-dependent oxidoreductase [unclassified Geodermatophilus]|uniref:FAD-dependent oxidoreductase n=1 Tax=unclassified Geodermatophilus TaxID=2637632 RepID=UPI003EECFFF1